MKKNGVLRVIVFSIAVSLVIPGFSIAVYADEGNYEQETVSENMINAEREERPMQLSDVMEQTETDRQDTGMEKCEEEHQGEETKPSLEDALGGDSEIPIAFEANNEVEEIDNEELLAADLEMMETVSDLSDDLSEGAVEDEIDEDDTDEEISLQENNAELEIEDIQEGDNLPEEERVEINASSEKKMALGATSLQNMGIKTAPSEETIKTGWEYIYEDGKLVATRYLGSDGKPVTGQRKIDGYWYYFDPNNNSYMVQNRTVDFDASMNKGVEKTCYYDTKGHMVYGQRKIDGYWYMFRPGNGGMVKTDFFAHDENTNPVGGAKTCYYDANGHMIYKQKKIDGYWYMFRLGNGGMVKSALYTHDENTNPVGGEKTCYYDAYGHMIYKQRKIENYWYMFRPGNGGMVKSDFYAHDTVTNPNGGAKTCYYDANGHMVYKQKKIDGYWYMFRLGNGGMVKSDFYEHDAVTNPNGGEKTCYYDADGHMVYNEKEIGGYWYMFLPGNGAMVTSRFFTHDASMNPDGETKTCYYDANGQRMHGIQVIEGKTWFLDSFTGAVVTKSTLKALEVMRSWLGYNTIDGSQHQIIDIYNSVYPLPVGYRVTYYDDWCDACVSAAGIVAGISNIIGRECGVERHINIFKNLNIWIEDGTIIPKPGYIITFSWGAYSQPNDGYGDHIAYVENVSDGMITIIEGNHDNQVMRRVFRIGDPDIRGYAAPYDVR